MPSHLAKTTPKLTPQKLKLTALHLLLALCLFPTPALARLCYSCSGQCMLGAPCNCQMGSCEADYCFAEKRPSEVTGVFRLTKGCVKRPARVWPGCDFDHFVDHVLCVCSGPGDFCNDHILMRVNTATWRNVTCRMCPDGRPDCGQTCQGQWCHQKQSTGASGCGFGPPSLPYLYQTHELLRQQPKVCLSLSRGHGTPHKFCVCTGHLCNEPESAIGRDQRPTLFTSILRSISGSSGQQQQQQRSISRHWEMNALATRAQQQQPLYECVSCDLSSEDSAMTSNCRQNRCRGQFCVYAAQRVFGMAGSSQPWASASRALAQNGGAQLAGQQMAAGNGNGVMHEKQGCMNVSEPLFVQLGCYHKWVQNELEEIYCACRGDICNMDLSTASASSTLPTKMPPSIIVFSSFILSTIFTSSFCNCAFFHLSLIFR